MIKLSLIVLLLIPFFCFSQTKWELKKNHDGIAVYVGDIANENFKEIRVVCEINSSTTELVRVLQDVNHHADWVYKTKSTRLISRKNKDTVIYYSETMLPWPVNDRDLVIRMTFESDTLNKTLKIEGRAMPNVLPVKAGIVRVPSSVGLWKVTAVNSNRIKIDYNLRVHPGGALPAWLVNMMATVGPFNTFHKLKEILESKSQ